MLSLDCELHVCDNPLWSLMRVKYAVMVLISVETNRLQTALHPSWRNSSLQLMKDGWVAHQSFWIQSCNGNTERPVAYPAR